MSARRNKAYLALLINSILWGVAPPLVKLALPYTTPFRWLFYRYIIAVILTLPLLILYIRKYKPTHKTIFTIIALESLGTTLVLFLLYEGLKQSSVIDTSLIAAMSPLFVIIGSIIFLHERQKRNEWLGFMLAFIGTLAIALEPLILYGRLTNGGSVIGNLFILTHNVVWMIYALLAKRLYQKLPPLLVTMISFWVGLVSFGILAFFTSPSLLFSDLSQPWVGISALYMAIPGSIIAATLYIYGQKGIEVSEAALFSYLQPAVSMPLALIFLHEKVSFLTVGALLLIIFGVYLAERRPRRV